MGRSSWNSSSEYESGCGKYFDDLIFEDGWLIAYFDGNTAINDYIGANDCGYGYDINGDKNYVENGKRPISTAIVFNDICDDGLQWDYTIRVNDGTVAVQIILLINLNVIQIYYIIMVINDIKIIHG